MDEIKAKNWVAFPVPEGCRGIAVSFDREVAQMQVDEHGATPLFGLSESDDQTEAFLPIRIYVTDGGDLIPDRKYQAPPERLVHATQTHGRSER